MAFVPNQAFLTSCPNNLQSLNLKIQTVREPNTALFAKSGSKKKKVKDGTITVNRSAYRNYEVIETMTAGVSLIGTGK